MAKERGQGLVIRQLGPMVQAMTNLFQPQSTTIVGVRTQDWMGPGQPVKPVAPDGTQPRGLQYFQSHNLTYTPRAYEEYSADDLQQASMYPLARVLIENVKDTISRWPIEIGLRRLPGETGKEFASRKPDRSIITAISDIVENPNPDMNRQEFTRRLCEDMLVIDAASALMRTTPKGNLIEIRPITGASITRYIDTQGFTPQPPSPAYAQVWYNLPFVDLTTKQLLYAARNILPNDIYGTCYDDQTEILTETRGFVLFKDLLIAERVATRNCKTKEFEWSVPSRIVAEQYSGEMVSLQSKSMDIVVTPQHRMLVSILSEHGKRNEKIITAESMVEHNHREQKIPVVSRWSGGCEIGEVFFARTARQGRDVRMSGDDFCALMGAYLSEGNRRSAGGIEVNQLKKSKGFQSYSDLFKRINGGKDGFNGKAFVCSNYALNEYFSQFGNCAEKSIPINIRNSTARQLSIFWEYFMLGDGYSSFGRGRNINRRRDEITTTSRTMADQLVEIGQKLGWSVSVAPRLAHRRNIKGRQYWCRESYHLRCRYSSALSVTAKKLQYVGMVYCVTVPNRIVYVRRNGKPAWSGNSPVQQGMRWIQIGSARLDFKMNAYSDGNIPDAIQVVPMGVPVGNITEAQNWMVSDLAGNLKKRRQMRLIQGFTEDGKDQILFPKESLLSDPYDEFEINEFCFLFGVSRQRLSKMLQRSAAQSDQEAADKEGLEPFLDWMRNSVWNRIIQKYLGFTDYEAKFSEDQQLDALKQAQVEDVRLKNATMTINEAREARGEDPRPEAEANEPMIYTASGLVPINVDKEIERSKKKLDAMPPPVAGPGFGGGFGSDSGDAKTQAKIAKLESQHATIEEALRSLNDIARQMLGEDALLNKGLGPALVVPSVAERIMLQNILNKQLPQNLVLKLYQNDRVPRSGDVAANYQEANFIGYSAAVLSGDQWKLDNGIPVGAVGETQVFTSKADQPGQAIFGYYVVQADSGLLMWAERFVPNSVFGEVPVVIAQNRASIAVTPVLTLSKGKSN